MMIDGRGLEVDIASRTIVAELKQNQAGAMLRVDAAMVVAGWACSGFAVWAKLRVVWSDTTSPAVDSAAIRSLSRKPIINPVITSRRIQPNIPPNVSGSPGNVPATSGHSASPCEKLCVATIAAAPAAANRSAAGARVPSATSASAAHANGRKKAVWIAHRRFSHCSGENQSRLHRNARP